MCSIESAKSRVRGLLKSGSSYCFEDVQRSGFLIILEKSQTLDEVRRLETTIRGFVGPYYAERLMAALGDDSAISPR